MQYDIFFSNLDRSKVLQLPILPKELPELKRGSKNEEFETYNDGTYNLLGPVGLVSVQLDCWLPGKGKNYPFQRIKNVNPDEYILFLDIARLNKQPIRLIISRSDGTFYLNETFTIEELNWKEDKMCNYYYSLGLKQWREIK